MDSNKVIFFEGGMDYLSKTELKEIKHDLQKLNIELGASSSIGVYKQFIFDIGIFINESLVNTIINNILLSATYDMVKSCILKAIRAIRSKVKVFQGDETRPAEPYIRFYYDDRSINVLIPDSIENDILSEYLDSAIHLIRENQEEIRNVSKTEDYVIEMNMAQKMATLKTMHQYAWEKAGKQDEK